MNFKDLIETGNIEQFAKEHEVKDPLPDGTERFWKLFGLMSENSTSSETSDGESSEGYDETQTRQGTSKDVSD